MKSATIITHNATFHADEVFGVAILMLALEKEYSLSVIRTRDPEIIKKGDYVLDVGSVYDEATFRFDHHQEGGAGIRKNGVPYAACGLVWKTFGTRITLNEEVAQRIEQELIIPIDASDNGLDTYSPLIDGVRPVLIQEYIGSFNPTWKEEDASSDDLFLKMVAYAKVFIERKIKTVQDGFEGAAYVQDAYEKAEDKRLIILDEDYPWENILVSYPEPLFVVYPNAMKDMWRVKTVRVNSTSYKSRKELPLSWAGKIDADIQEETGVADSVFCHNKRFTAAARSKEGAILLAHKALEN